MLKSLGFILRIMENPWRVLSRGLTSKGAAFLNVHAGSRVERVPEGNEIQDRQPRRGAAAAIQTYLDLRGSPFLTVTAVSVEVLRAQEEWEAVDNIRTETGNRGNGTVSTQPSC